MKSRRPCLVNSSPWTFLDAVTLVLAATHPQRVECALSCLEKAKRIHAPASLSSNGAELAFLFNLLWLRVSVQMLSYFA